MRVSLAFRAALLSATLLALFLLAWHVAVRGVAPVQAMDPEYAKLVGATASQGKSAIQTESPIHGFERAAKDVSSILPGGMIRERGAT